VRLEKLDFKHSTPEYLSWMNDDKVNKYNSHGHKTYMQDDIDKYIYESSRDNHKMVFAILEDGKHIGNCAIQDIHYQNESAEISWMIGDKRYWGKGIGTMCGKSMLAHCFSWYHLHRVWLGTSALNVAMNKIAINLGMTKVGTLRQALYADNIYQDVIQYDILKHEWAINA